MLINKCASMIGACLRRMVSQSSVHRIIHTRTQKFGPQVRLLIMAAKSLIGSCLLLIAYMKPQEEGSAATGPYAGHDILSCLHKGWDTPIQMSALNSFSSLSLRQELILDNFFDGLCWKEAFSPQGRLLRVHAQKYHCGQALDLHAACCGDW